MPNCNPHHPAEWLSELGIDPHPDRDAAHRKRYCASPHFVLHCNDTAPAIYPDRDQLMVNVPAAASQATGYCVRLDVRWPPIRWIDRTRSRGRSRHPVLLHLPSSSSPTKCIYWQDRWPRGSGNVQFCVVPSCVITTFAVAEPSYVITSRREDVVGEPPDSVTVTLIARITVPAVGYGNVVVLAGTGITTLLTVSPATRLAVNAPCGDLPVVFSVPADAPSIVRLVLPLARPEMVSLLDSLTTLVLLSRRVTVPFTVTVVATVLVRLSIFGCGWPDAVVYFEIRVTVSPLRVVEQVTRPVALEYEHELSAGKCRSPSPRNGPPSPPPMKPRPNPGPR